MGTGEANLRGENRQPQDLKRDSLLPSRFACCYDAAKAAAFAVEDLQPRLWSNRAGSGGYMTLTELGALGEFVAAVAVLITLVYLTVQVRQGNALARSQTLQRMVEQAERELYRVVEDPAIFKCFLKDDPLTEEEKIKLTCWLLASLRQREYEWFQYRDGNIDRQVWEAYQRVMLSLLTTARTREWWGSFLSTTFDPAFVAEVDQLIENSPPTDFFERFKKSSL